MVPEQTDSAEREGKVQRIYIVIPKTVELPHVPFKLSMSCGRMAIHVLHTGGLLKESFPEADLGQEAIALSVPGSDYLELLIAEAGGLRHVLYKDPDKPFEGTVSALAVLTSTEEERKVFAGLRPWKCKCNESAPVAQAKGAPAI